jgi:PGAP1-like protein
MPANPDFPLPPAGFRAEWARMRADPRPLPRPLVVLAGWRAPRFPSVNLARFLAGLSGAPASPTLAISFTFRLSMDAAVRRACDLVERRFPSASPADSTEVDLVGISMGGLIARAAAIPGSGRKRLRIARMFTLGTPHRGARMARLIPLDPLVRGMRPGSTFLSHLDGGPLAYELVCYTRLRDSWVGARNTAPHGSDPFWTPGPLLLSHQTISLDPLIRTDIARRLRGEPPLAVRASPPPRI